MKASFRILHLSDPHFGAADDVAAEDFLRTAGELAPDLTVLSGDLTMRARRQELAEAKAFVDALPTPFVMIPGNHDIPALNHPIDRFFSPFRRYRKVLADDLEPTLRLESAGLELFSLNSTRAIGPRFDWSEGHLSQRQFRRLDEYFASPSPGFRILVLHHPLLAPRGHRRAIVEPLPPLLRSLSSGHIDLVMCGHFHCSLVATAGSGGDWHAVVSQAPTVCSTRLQGEPPGFHMIERQNDRLTVILHRHQAGGFQEAARHHFQLGSDGWTTMIKSDS